MKEIITKIDREKGFNYSVDKQGNVVKEKYNILKDRWTLVTLCIIVLGIVYYLQISSMMTTEKNFEPMCLSYMELRALWMSSHPGQTPTLDQVLRVEKAQYFNNPTINISKNDTGLV